jgi:hypothetical protein
MKKNPTTRTHLNRFFTLIATAFLPLVLQAQFFPSQEENATALTTGEEFYSFTVDQFDSVFFVRLAINLISMIVLLRLIYYRITGRHDFFFTFFMFNLIIFIITILLNSGTSFSIGAAFGLFAIFAMLRYRTEDISTRDMTYLFLSITIGLISSINQGTALEIVLINVIILLTAFLVESNVFLKQEFIKTVEYENIELIKPEKHPELLRDLRDRTGLDIHKVYIKRIDFLRDTALIKIHYRSSKDRDA